MAFILNATDEEQSFKVVGNWFTFKAKQIKQMNDDIARFIAGERRSTGCVMLPDEFESLEYRSSEEGKKALEVATETGVNNYVEHLRQLIYNNQVSMRADLEKANIKVDPAAFASPAELDAMRMVAKYQKKEKDMAQAKINEVNDLMKAIKE